MKNYTLHTTNKYCKDIYIRYTIKLKCVNI